MNFDFADLSDHVDLIEKQDLLAMKSSRHPMRLETVF